MIIGSTIIHKKSLPSSFDYVKKNSAVFDDGTVVICDHIEQARGRNGRKWHVDEGQLLITILLKPSILDNSKINYLAMALSCGLLKSFHPLPVSFKWPNDIILSGKKIAGMLVEPIWKGTSLEGLAVGIGINLNNHFSPTHELSPIATSVADFLKQPYDKEAFLQSLFISLNEAYSFFLEASYKKIYDQWCSHQVLLSKKIKIETRSSEIIEGVVRSFLLNGDIELYCESTDQKYTIPFYLTHSITLLES